MQILRTIPYFILFGLFFFSCKKQEIPATITDSPYFEVNAIFDGQNLGFTAGQNDIYLYTRSGTLADSIIANSGHFTEANCQNCPNSLEFTFKNPIGGTGVLSPTQKVEFTAASFAASFVDTIFQTSLMPSPFDDRFTYSWNVNSVVNSTMGPNVNVDLVNDQTHTIQMTTTDIQTNNIYVSEVDIDLNNQTPCLLGNLKTSPNPNAFDSSIIFEIDLAGTLSPIDFEWSTGDTNATIVIDQPGTYCITLTDGIACEQRICATINSLQNHSTTTIPSISYQFEPIYDVSTLDLAYGAQIRYVDDSGVEWDSEFGIQSENAFFKILSSDTYEVNEREQPTQQLDIDFDCFLYNDTGESKPIFGSGKIAVGK